MWILTQEGKRLIDMNRVERISIVQSDDAARIVAYLPAGQVQGKNQLGYYHLGRYTPLEARDCFRTLIEDMEFGKAVFEMPESDTYDYVSVREMMEEKNHPPEEDGDVIVPTAWNTLKIQA